MPLQLIASTGLAAFSINGTSLHAFAGIGLGLAPIGSLIQMLKSRTAQFNRWNTLEVLIIDEVSMISGIL